MKYYSIKESAQILDVSERWLQMCCKNGSVFGARRLNEQGAWMIPEAWISSELNKTKIEPIQIIECNAHLKNLVFVFDEMTESFGRKFLKQLEKNAKMRFRFCVLPLYSHESEEVITDRLHVAIGNNVNTLIGITSSGNGVAIFANKLNGIFAATVNSTDDIDEAISTFHANAFDISVQNQDCVNICKYIIERVQRDEMEH